MLPELSIIIPTINRTGDLFNTLNDLLNQSEKSFEILVFDQSESAVGHRLPSDPRIRYFHVNYKSAAIARNEGLKKSKADIVLFLDDDLVIENRNLLSLHLRHYDDASIVGVCGGIRTALSNHPRNELPKPAKWPKIGWLYFPGNYALPSRLSFAPSGNLSVRKKEAIEAGGMDEQFVKAAHREESDFCLRLCRNQPLIQFDPEAWVYHIGSAQGGSRNWNSGSPVKAQHHFDGALYFIFKNARLEWRWYHYLEAFRYFVLKKNMVRSPANAFRAIGRFAKAHVNAGKMLAEGPLLLSQ